MAEITETLAQRIDNTRQATVKKYYQEVVDSINTQITADPLKETFVVKSTCPNEKIAALLSKMLLKDEVTATYAAAGMMSSATFTVTRDLPAEWTETLKELEKKPEVEKPAEVPDTQ